MLINLGIAVYKLERQALKNTFASPWAVKKLLKGGKSKKIYGSRLKNEASVLKKLQHPNIVGYRGVFKDMNGEQCLAMEQCTISLGDLIENRFEESTGIFPPENIFKVAFDVSKALNYCHNTALLLHGDIKSYNVLIKDEFVICKLCDFGTSIPLNSNGSVDNNNTIPYIGTQCWSAPEVLKKPQKITTKADIFSLGLVFWEMIGLQPPMWHDDDSIDEVNIYTRTKSRPDLPKVDYGPTFNLIFDLYYSCTAELRKDRPSATELMSKVEGMIKEMKLDELLK